MVSKIGATQTPPASGGGDAYAPVISPDGRYVLFASAANNLTLNNSNSPLPLVLPARLNVFLRDRTMQTTTLVSVNLAATSGGNGDSWPSALSSNAQYALFESSATDLTLDATNNVTQVFLRDLIAGTNLLVSVNTNGVGGNGASRYSVMTPDGRYVAFASDASDLVADDTNGLTDVTIKPSSSRATPVMWPT